MRPCSLLLLALITGLHAAPRVLPTPQFQETRPASVVLKRTRPVQIQVAPNSARAMSIAVELIQSEWKNLRFAMVSRANQGPSIILWDRSAEGPPPIPLADSSTRALDPVASFGQGYVLETRSPSEVWIVGSTAQGVLNGAATLIQLGESRNSDIHISGTFIRDYPSFRYRAAADWLLRAELNRWAYEWGDGRANYIARVKRKLDFCMRFKINMVAFDGFGWTAEKRPGYAAMMRTLNAYARERGIKLLFGGYGANFYPRAIEPEFNIGKAHVNRRFYPDGDTYICFGEERTRLQPTFGTCRSNDALQREIAREIQEFVRAVEPGALYIHHEDTGHYETTQVRWSKRCEQCQRRWPNPDFAAIDGGAGAMAHGYSNIFNAVGRVHNHDSGYDAARDCTVAFISPAYGVDSQRSGLGSEKVDPELNWTKTLEFWANAVDRMPRAETLEIGLREIFPNKASERWMDAWNSTMRARNLRGNVFMFFLGGADQYSNGVFSYPFTGNSVMNGMFDGAEAIYNFNGGLHQEPQQIINAEYSWNSNAPGRVTPRDFADGLKRWNDLMSNSEMPPAVFGPDGLFRAACSRLYGPRAGASMARFFEYFEDRNADAAGLPAFYPQRLYSFVVLWRALTGDAPYSDLEPSAVEQAHLTAQGQSRQQFQRSLAALWSQTARVNQAAARHVDVVQKESDLRSDVREDVAYLRKCLTAGERFAQLLSGYHDLLATAPAERKTRLEAVASAHRSLNQWLHKEFQFDFTDPKGGDQAAWLETMELLTARLQQMRGQ